MPTKPKKRREPRKPLSEVPPATLTGRAKEVYAELAGELIAEGYACAGDWRAVALAAETTALLERLVKEIAALPDLASPGSKGQVRVHPLLMEVRAQRQQLANLLGLLLITPRSRSTSRLTEGIWRDGNSQPDELDDFLAGRAAGAAQAPADEGEPDLDAFLDAGKK